MPATLDICSSSGDCGVRTANDGSSAATPASLPMQVQSGVVDGSSTKDRVLFRDVEDFERKRQAFAAGGSNRLQIISGARSKMAYIQ